MGDIGSGRETEAGVLPGRARTFDRVLLKISGEALMGDQGFGLHPPTVQRIAREVGTFTPATAGDPGPQVSS